MVNNYGSAGSNSLKCGLYNPTRFMQRDMDLTPLGYQLGETMNDCAEPIIGYNEGLLCATGDSFVVNDDINIKADMYDMEAYALAKVCFMLGVRFICAKFISDKLNASEWDKQLALGEDMFIKWLEGK